ncbi:MAG: histidinol dehydrogenase [Oligosphaeraceae bacterium]|nr:histidinol dehydrogenase [Oligosphaeraceae bacterium]
MLLVYRDDDSFAEKIKPLQNRTAFSGDVDRAVREILEQVRKEGDRALVRLAEKFDQVKLNPAEFLVDAREFAAAATQVDEETKAAIRLAIAQVQDFAVQKKPKNWFYSPREGVMLGEQFSPLQRVGCYVPGGTAPLVSTVIHTVAIAAAAGVEDIVVTTPPGKDGSVNAALLYACKQAGASRVYRLGGVYGIAALAYGTESVEKVEKIVGPGNAYVTAAKRLVYGEVALDLVAGPSEIMIIADASANPAFIAADMLSQAEHGSGREQAVLLSTCADLLTQVKAELSSQSKRLSRSDCVEQVLENGVFLIEVKDLDEAASLASQYAAEHLELMVAEPEKLAPKIKAAGAIFMGHWSPEPLGDFVAGPSHVLPTGGSGRFFNGLSIEMFFRRSSLLRYEKEALFKEIPAILKFAENEGLDAHGKSAAIRKKCQ